MHGGDLIATVLEAHGVQFLFTLCGGHISPILSGSRQRGIRVIDVRHEATAVFAADAVARLTGIPGVAAVTAGPGTTNTITAVKNAQMAQSPVVILGGAAPTALKGRGALQDIDQIALYRPVVKWSASVKRVRDLIPVLSRAFAISAEGVPGPVFVECPLDLLYDKALVKDWYVGGSSGRGVTAKAVQMYMRWHVHRMFAGAKKSRIGSVAAVTVPEPDPRAMQRARGALADAERPLIVIGSQALLEPGSADRLADAITTLGVPVYLSGMARGLLGTDHPLHMRHKRRLAIRDADTVILAGVPCDFRLDYGRQIRRSSFYIAANRSRDDIRLNRRPNLAVRGDPGRFLCDLAASAAPKNRDAWLDSLRDRDAARETEIATQADAPGDDFLNPVSLCREINAALPDDSVLVADGGDFVGTASYIIRPRGPLRWLDPGPFGTLGVGAGFALGAALCRPGAQVWIVFGDGSVGYSLTEFDTFVRHGIPVVAVVGNDACWSQIAREQVKILSDDVGTVLARSDYHLVAEALGARGLLLKSPGDMATTLQQARTLAADGHPVLVNAWLGKTDFREGSLSM